MWPENPGPPPQLRLPGPGGGVSPARRVRKSHRATLEPRMAQLARAGLGAGFVYFWVPEGQQPRGFLPPSSLPPTIILIYTNEGSLYIWKKTSTGDAAVGRHTRAPA